MLYLTFSKTILKENKNILNTKLAMIFVFFLSHSSFNASKTGLSNHVPYSEEEAVGGFTNTNIEYIKENKSKGKNILNKI